MSIANDVKSKMEHALEHVQKELRNLRTNRANPAMVDGVLVEVYGSEMKIKELASVSAPEPRQLLITPFDPQTAGPIAKGIEKANLNLQAILEGSQIRVPIPPMNEDMRKEIAKQAKKKGEDAKISIRDIRRKGNELARKQKADGELPEDVMKKTEKQIQELTDEYCKKVDEAVSAKEKDLMEV